MDSMIDPRAWNLLAGLSLIAGCGGRTVGAEGASTDDAETSSSSDTLTSESTSESTGDECVTDADCPPGYYCLEGVCDYQIAPDGGPWYECYGVDDCGPLSLCVDYMCQFVDELGGCEPSAAQPIPRSIDGSPLALSFVDLDADGADELVVATGDEFYAFESDSDLPSASARLFVSASIEAMVAGDFDPAPGKDLMLIASNMLAMHPSDGVAGFGAPEVNELAPLGQLRGLSAAQLDATPGTEVLISSTAGAAKLTQDTISFLGNQMFVQAASARDPSVDGVGIVLRLPGELWFLDAATTLVTSTVGHSSGDEPLVSLLAASERLELDAAWFNVNQPWTSLRLLALDQVRAQWGIDGTVTAMVAGDLDGDGDDELALLLEGGGVQLLQNVGSGAECWLALESFATATHLATGDWDGDGDDELAIAAATGELLVHDDV